MLITFNSEQVTVMARACLAVRQAIRRARGRSYSIVTSYRKRLSLYSMRYLLY